MSPRILFLTAYLYGKTAKNVFYRIKPTICCQKNNSVAYHRPSDAVPVLFQSFSYLFLIIFYRFSIIFYRFF